MEIHNYISGGRVYHANANPPSIPRALAGSIRAANLQDGPHRNSAPNPQGSNETVLYDFTGTPYDAVLGGVTDKAGNLYGTTPGGGAAGLGAIFKMDTSGNETFLYSFTAGNMDGISPNPGLSMDSAGNLYGTTFLGGSNNWGTVFKLDPTGHETVLYSFTGGADGGNPIGGVAIDSAGNIYGTTSSGGVTGVCCGAIFKLDPTGQEKLLHSFTGANGDGKFPNGGLIQDSVGNIYGTTLQGGVTGGCCGTVFKVDPAGHETVLYSFLLANQGNGDGAFPNGGLTLDSAGNLYGTTNGGGLATGCSYCGTVFKIDPTGHETMLYNFTGTNGDGSYPKSGLIKDSQGNLYGTTYGGGVYNGCYFGCGTVFKVDPTGKEMVLHEFTGGSDGGSPNSGLIMDSTGNLYGSNQLYSQPTAANPAIVFKVDPAGQASALYTFPVTNGDGAGPTGGLIMDSAGNLYGTTQGGGDTRCGDLSSSGCGTVFKLDSSTGHESVLYSFTGSKGDGATPAGGLVMDAAGNLFGTTQGGGNDQCLVIGCGIVFKLDPTGHETVLYSFAGGNGDGAVPQAPLIMDVTGNLYGTTQDGGGTLCGNLNLVGCGTVFKLDPTGHETVLYTFTDSNGDGAAPNAPLAMDAAGNLYGTTQFGGDTLCDSHNFGCGIVFELDPTGHETVLHTFTASNGGDSYPSGGLIKDSAGNLYGTTSGTTSGTVFKLDPAGHETVLYSFTGAFNDGISPNGGLILDSVGNLYGTTQFGGGTPYVAIVQVAAPFSSSIPPDTRPCSTPSPARMVTGRPPLAR